MAVKSILMQVPVELAKDGKADIPEGLRNYIIEVPVPEGVQDGGEVTLDDFEQVLKSYKGFGKDDGKETKIISKAPNLAQCLVMGLTYYARLEGRQIITERFRAANGDGTVKQSKRSKVTFK